MNTGGQIDLGTHLPGELNSMVTSKSSISEYCKERAAVCAWCAERTISAETKAALLHCGREWLILAEITEPQLARADEAPDERMRAH
jgi:hypothetical protein